MKIHTKTYTLVFLIIWINVACCEHDYSQRVHRIVRIKREPPRLKVTKIIRVKKYKVKPLFRHHKPKHSAPPKYKYGPPSSSYSPPSSSYGSPSSSYSPPSTNYGLPSQSYGPPSSNYGAPSSNYGAPSSNYNPPSTSYGSPSSGSPAINYPAPMINYNAPSQGPSLPASNYNAPPSNFGIPSTNYGTPTVVVNFGNAQTPTANYGSPSIPSQNYGSPSIPSQNYGSPSIPSQNYGSPSIPSQNYGTPIYQVPQNNYAPPPPVSNYNTPITSYGSPSSNNYNSAVYVPSQMYSNPNVQQSSYSTLHSSPGYEVPSPSFGTPPLSYDPPSASYGTPGAVTSYGTPVNNNKNLDTRSNQNKLDTVSPITGDTYTAGSSVAINYTSTDKVKQNPSNSNEKKLLKINLKVRNNENSTTQPEIRKSSNHNYDGPGIVDDDFYSILSTDKTILDSLNRNL